MGLDLRLLPIEHDGGSFSFSHSILNCHDTERGLYNALMKMEKGAEGERVPSDFSTFVSRDDEVWVRCPACGDQKAKYEETHYGNTQETPCGEPVRCVRVSDLLRLKDIATDRCRQNRAVWAYLSEMDPNMRVALFWH